MVSIFRFGLNVEGVGYESLPLMYLESFAERKTPRGYFVPSFDRLFLISRHCFQSMAAGFADRRCRDKFCEWQTGSSGQANRDDGKRIARGLASLLRSLLRRLRSRAFLVLTMGDFLR